MREVNREWWSYIHLGKNCNALYFSIYSKYEITSDIKDGLRIQFHLKI